MKNIIIKYLFRHIIGIIIPDDVITFNKGKIYLGGKEIEQMEYRSIVAEVKALKDMRIWSIINETIKQKAFERGWKDSTSMDQLNSAKMMYHTLDIQNSILALFNENRE